MEGKEVLLPSIMYILFDQRTTVLNEILEKPEAM